jgi:hypothetical protein
MSVAVRRLLLDSLKPRELSIITLTTALGSVEGVETVDVVVIEVNSKTETIKVTITGPQIDYDSVQKVMAKHGVSIKGIDEIGVTKT